MEGEMDGVEGTKTEGTKTEGTKVEGHEGTELSGAMREAGMAGAADAAEVRENERGLSPEQIRALRALDRGCSLWQAAKAAGVTRRTLHEWRGKHAAFSDVMDRWEARQLEYARSRMQELVPLAIDRVLGLIYEDDMRATRVVLRSLRLLQSFEPTPPPAEATEE
jgi:hypothetical protein